MKDVLIEVYNKLGENKVKTTHCKRGKYKRTLYVYTEPPNSNIADNGLTVFYTILNIKMT